MPLFQVVIEKDSVCPDIILHDASVYPVGTDNQERSDFRQFAKVYLSQPNGTVLPLNALTPYNNQLINVPSSNLDSSIKNCMTGLFGLKYIALPTPRESESQDSTWATNDCFYYQGKIYKVVDGFLMPDLTKPNDQILAEVLASGTLIEITEDEISSDYISEISFTNFCSLAPCLRKKLRKINCLIVQEPTRTDICEMKLYEEILVLWAYNTTASITNNGQADVPVPVTPAELDYYRVMSNFVNPTCCCGCDCCEDCSDCGGNRESDNLVSPNMSEVQNDLPEDLVKQFECVEAKLKTSFCNGCKCCDICKNKEAVNVIKATLLIAELQLYGGDKTSEEYLNMVTEYTTTMKILCQC